MNLNKIRIKEIILEELEANNIMEVMSVFESECSLTVSMDINITDVLTKIRAIESVTIVNIIPGGGKRVGRGAERIQLKLKFVKGGYSVKHRLTNIIAKATRVDGVVGFKVHRTRKTEAT